MSGKFQLMGGMRYMRNKFGYKLLADIIQNYEAHKLTKEEYDGKSQ